MALSEIQRRIRRSKESERDLGKWLLAADAPDPIWKYVSSSTGRVGHITNLQFDVISMSYVAENKQVKMPAKMLQWWLQITDLSKTHGKAALLRIEPTNVVPGRKTLPELHVITKERHEELLRLAKYADQASYILESMPSDMDDMSEGWEPEEDYEI